MINVLHIIPVWSLSTGPSQILFHLLNREDHSDYQHHIAIFNKRGFIPNELKKFRVYVFPTLIFHRWKWSPRFNFFLKTHFPQFDIIHLHGCWIYPNFIVYRLSKKYSIPYIFRPAGALSNQAIESKRKWIKIIYFHFLEKRIVEQAVCIHALSNLEKKELLKLKSKCPIVLSPPTISKPNYSLIKVLSFVPKEVLNKKILLSICSLSPIKNLEFLSAVLQKVKLLNPNFCWIIAGPYDNPYGKKLKKKISKNLGQNVWFAGAINHSEKYTLLKVSTIFLSASKSENFGLAILEALMSNTLVIAGENQPWKKQIKENLGFSIPLSFPQFYHAILKTLDSSTPKLNYHPFQHPYTWGEMYKDIFPIK